MNLLRASFLFPALLASLLTASASGPFSQSKSINFYREVASRDIVGLGLRSDGRLIAGPMLQELAGIPLEDLWWDLEHLESDSWLIATGPNGRVIKADIDSSGATYQTTPWGESGSNHIFVLKKLSADLIVGGSNPDGQVIFWDAQGEELARVALPADSVFDLLWDDRGERLLAATGNPGSLYQIDPDVVLASSPDDNLESRGVTLLSSIRDRNLRRLALAADGAILGGSAPSGNLYRFSATQNEPVILMDQEAGEITDIQVGPNGDIYATLVVASGNTTRRVMQSANVQPPKEAESKAEDKKPDSPAPSIFEAPPIDAFTGRSELILVPGGDGIPRTLSSRNKVAMYRITRYGDKFLLGGGDDGEILGYDPLDRRALYFAGSNSAQINDIESLPNSGEFLLLSNNPLALSKLSSFRQGPRTAQTGSINLPTPSELGALRFNRLRDVDPVDLQIRMRANRSSDAAEGWTEWQTASREDDLWKVDGLIGKHVQVELELPADLAATAQLDQAELFFLPQNRRPVLRSFRIVSPNYGLVPRTTATQASTGNLTLGQVIGSSPNPSANSEDKQRQALLSSNLVPQLGAQVVTWTVSDPDGDNLNAKFSVRASESDEWIDLSVGANQGWLQFDRRSLAEGTYFSRLWIEEDAPRTPEDRQHVEFATDDLVIDLTPPVITAATVSEASGKTTVSIEARDAYSALEGVRLAFNNGYSVEVNQPTDGMLDGRSEQFFTSIDQRLIAMATAVEIYVMDSADNVAVKRIKIE